jgi:Subtilase family
MAHGMSHGDGQDSKLRKLRAGTLLGLLAAAGWASLGSAQPAAAKTVSPLPASDYAELPVCAAPAPGHARCLALELVPETAAASAHTHPLGMTHSAPGNAAPSAEGCEVEHTAANGCFGLRPQEFHSAYQLPTSAPTAQTIAVADAFNNPNAEEDLEAYDKEFGLPECTTADGCFQKVNEKGETGNLPYPASKREQSEQESFEMVGRTLGKGNRRCPAVEEVAAWASESSLDIEIAHGICQNCHILLVEAASSEYDPNVDEAEDTAARLGATEISDSFGQPETQPDSEAPGSEAFNHPGVVITAAAGDEGYLNGQPPRPEEQRVDYPASSPDVVAVGGTRLSLEEGAWKEETVWNGTGSGCSELFAAPKWQLSLSNWPSVGCGENRAVADISADADPDTGAAIYNPADKSSSCERGWCTFGGTSLASPLIAAVFALAGGAHGVEYPARTLYENELSEPGSLHDVVAGSNGECKQQAICLAGPGYDGPSGLGTPNGIAAFEPFTAGPMKGGGGGGTGGGSGGGGNGAGSGGGGGSGGSGGGNSGGSGGGSGGANGGSGDGPGAGAPGSGPIPSPIGSVAAVVRVSALALTPRATTALKRTRPRASQIGFAFTISSAAQVRATLARRVRVKGKTRMKLLPDSLAFTASTGRNSRSLRGRNTLAPGSYRLTLTPAHGVAQSIAIQIR